MRLSYSASSDSLSARDQKQLAELVEGSRFFDLPEVIGSQSPGVDRFQYTISVENDEGTHIVQVGEDSVPVELRPLVNWLTNASR